MPATQRKSRSQRRKEQEAKRAAREERQRKRVAMRAEMLALRSQDWTWREIGNRFGLSEQNAWQIGTNFKRSPRPKNGKRRRKVPYDSSVVSHRKKSARADLAQAVGEAILDGTAQAIKDGTGTSTNGHGPVMGSETGILGRLKRLEDRLGWIEQAVTSGQLGDLAGRLTRLEGVIGPEELAQVEEALGG